jgi:acetoin utilization protein AcuB
MIEHASAKRLQLLSELSDTPRIDRQEGLQVEQVMTRVPKCVAPETTAYELVKVFHTKGFRHLLVTNDEGLLVGVVSDRDVLRCFGGPNHSPRREELESITVAELMSTDLITVGPDVPMQRAVGLMLQQGISCLPVLENGLLRGIVTNTDLLMLLEILMQTLRHASLEELLLETVGNPQN